MKRFLMVLFLLALLVTASLALAQNSSYSLDWWTVDSGGAMSGDSRYTLQATIGQHDAGTMGDGRYTLYAGYWDEADHYAVYLPILMRPRAG